MVSDVCLDVIESIAEELPDSDWQRCAVYFDLKVSSRVPRGKMRDVAAMLKAIKDLQNRDEAYINSKNVISKLRVIKLKSAAGLVEM